MAVLPVHGRVRWRAPCIPALAGARQGRPQGTPLHRTGLRDSRLRGNDGKGFFSPEKRVQGLALGLAWANLWECPLARPAGCQGTGLRCAVQRPNRTVVRRSPRSTASQAGGTGTSSQPGARGSGGRSPVRLRTHNPVGRREGSPLRHIRKSRYALVSQSLAPSHQPERSTLHGQRARRSVTLCLPGTQPGTAGWFPVASQTLAAGAWQRVQASALAWG